MTIAPAVTVQASVVPALPAQLPQASTTATTPPLLNSAQMEQLANIMLGLTYVVLPIGLGMGLFWYDRHQAQRAATLKAQIKLLEKLWEQSPQV